MTNRAKRDERNKTEKPKMPLGGMARRRAIDDIVDEAQTGKKPPKKPKP